MSFISDIPYLGPINGGAEFRALICRIDCYAEINQSQGGDFGKTLFADFFVDQQSRVRKATGHPSDGVYLGLPGKDPRILAYHVLSAVRLNGSRKDKLAYVDFCRYFINKYRPNPTPPSDDEIIDGKDTSK